MSLLLLTLSLLGGVSGERRLVATHGDDVLPPVMLWAWHGSHELRTLDSEMAGVAFLAGTVLLSGDSVALLPGSERVDVPRGTALLPVVRIEVDPTRPPTFSERQIAEVGTAVVGFDDERFPGLQLDFDATHSQRPFYVKLLATVRAALGERFLSVAALASWCLGDPWLPVEDLDEIVPMLYRLGADADFVRARLASGEDFSPGCRSAVGLSTDESPEGESLLSKDDRRVYVFSGRRSLL